MLSRNFHEKYCNRCDQYFNGESPKCEIERTNFKKMLKKVAIGSAIGATIILIAKVVSNEDSPIDVPE